MPSAQLSFDQASPRRALRRLTVLPDAARVEDRLARLARTQGLVVGKVACSLAELERELVREARRAGRCPLQASPQAVALALREAAQDHSHGPFAPIRNQPGYARALADLLSALTQGMLEPGELIELPLSSPVREKLHALGRTLGAARARLTRAGLCDANRSVRLAVEALEAGLALPALLAQSEEVEFDGILDWTPLRLRLAVALAARLRVCIRLPWSAGRPELTAALEPTLRALEALGAGPAPELVLFDPAEGALAPFVRRLFAAEGAHVSGPVELVSCPSPSAQAREVARRCAQLLQESAAPDSIVIAARTLAGGVAEELAAALDRAGIPCRERRGRPALLTPPARLALSLLELAERDFPREPLIDLLSSRLLWAGDEPCPPQTLARCLRQAHVRDDRSEGGYAGRLKAYASRLRENAAFTKKDPARELAELETVTRRTLRALAALRRLPARATLRDHGAALLGLLTEWGLPRKLRAQESGEQGSPLARAAAAALARDQAGLRALDEACAGLARAAAQLQAPDKQLARAEYVQLLAAALAVSSVPAGGARGGAVQLVELREVWGRSVEHLLIVGLVDGELPARPAVDPLLSDEDKRAVNHAARRGVFRAPGDPGEALLLPPRQAEEPLLFQLALCAARSSAVLVWPRADAQGRELLRSPFVDESLRALGRIEEHLRAPLAQVPPALRCTSAQDLLARAALDAFAEPAFRVSPPPAIAEARSLAAALVLSPLRTRFERVARAALAERERLRTFVGETPPGRFSGGLTGAARALAAREFGASSVLSASQLEDHANCGFRTLGKRLLRLEVSDEDDDELSQRQRGTLLHRCLERFFARLRDEARLPLRGAPEELTTLRECAGQVMAAFEREVHVGHRALWELKQGEMLRELEDVLEAEAKLAPRPIELERRFGFPDPDSWPALTLLAPDGASSVCVRGAIDRIDRTGDGSWLLLDYKSGRLDGLRRKLKRATLLEPEFQLALYAALLQQREPGSAVGAAYLSLKDARRTDLLGQGKEAVDLDALLELDPAARTALRAKTPPPLNLADAVFRQAFAMREGLFPARPRTCEHCDLKPVCRLVALPTDPDENGNEVPRA